jgi:hypothetical protein
MNVVKRVQGPAHVFHAGRGGCEVHSGDQRPCPEFTDGPLSDAPARAEVEKVAHPTYPPARGRVGGLLKRRRRDGRAPGTALMAQGRLIRAGAFRHDARAQAGLSFAKIQSGSFDDSFRGSRAGH